MTDRRQELFDDTNWEQSITMGGRRELLDDTNWKEVMKINTYAVYMGYLSMAIKGLGFLVLTWTTVVLLGGFVSMLHKDFWCLAFITLVQTAGIFDVSLNEKLSYVGNSVDGMIMGAFAVVLGDNQDLTPANLVCFMLASALLFVQLVLLGAVLCPLAIVYMFGILMSGGISLSRLIEHDYSDSDGEASNLAPAMDTLYCLALLQGVLFCYRFILGCSGKRLAKAVATECDDSEVQLVYNYLHETRTGCEKDPSFVKGRNLITHAVHLIGSNSPVDCISGVNLLYTAICISEREMQKMVGESRIEKRNILIRPCMLMKHLVLSAPSSRHILKKLLETLDSRGLHDTETRYQAAVIVEHLAVDINLEQFPRGIQHISSLIGTFGQYSIAEPYQRDCQSDVKEKTWELRARRLALSLHEPSELQKDYKKLLLQGLRILRKLAADEKNCRVISDTPDLVSKIMAPVTSDLLHHTTYDQGAWSGVVEGSMEVMRQLICAPGETGAKLGREISSYKDAIITLHKILRCNKCNEELQLSTIRILTRLYVDTESSRSADFVVLKKESRENFVRMLVDIFTHENKSISIRVYAGGALSVLCFHGGISDATIIIQTRSGDVVDSLTKVLVHDKNRVKCPIGP